MPKHQRKNFKDDVWLTPPDLLKRLGSFDLDPCASTVRPWPTAAKHYTIEDNGLILPWHDRVWCNPPYSNVYDWLEKLSLHGYGMALVNANTQTQWFQKFIWNAAMSVFFPKGKIPFYRPDGERKGNGWNASVLVAYSQVDSEILYQAGLEGKFIPLVIKFAVHVRSTWRQLVRFFLRECGGVATLEQLYEMANGHPKTLANPNWKAKLRQRTQEEGERVGKATWKLKT